MASRRAGAPHVTAAHAAVRLGPAPAAASYLRVDAVIEAALDTGAGAIHPGYGLLSESAELALACEENGIAFVGPTAEQLRLFGDAVAAVAQHADCGGASAVILRFQETSEQGFIDAIQAPGDPEGL
mgnify:CR=1 FL=1